MTYGHLQADCLYTGISSGPNARYRVWEAFTFLLLRLGLEGCSRVSRVSRASKVRVWVDVIATVRVRFSFSDTVDTGLPDVESVE